MSDLAGEPPEICFTLTITRKATGKTETVDMVGHVVHETVKENINVRDPQRSSQKRSNRRGDSPDRSERES
jgi:hypothetical protein